MKSTTDYFPQKGSYTFMFWCTCFILLLPIMVLPPNFQPSDWSKSILFHLVLTTLISFIFYRFFYKKDLIISIPQWKNPVYKTIFALLGFYSIIIASTITSQD